MSYAAAPYETAGPTALAAQPPTLAKSEGAAGDDWGTIFTHLEKRLGALRMWRYSWWAYWASLAEYILPARYKWLVVANTYDRGFDKNNAIIDSTATLAMQVCAAGLWSGLTPPTRPWFKLGIGLPWIELDADGKTWLEDTEQRLYYVLGQSNFYSTMHQAFKDVTVFGTAPVVMYEDEDSVLRCYLPCSGEYYLAVGSQLEVDTIYFERTYTISQIVEMFKLENCPDIIRNMWEQGGASLENEYVVCCSIEPNFALSAPRSRTASVRVVPGSFAFREVYWLKGIKTERELSRRGFHERPHFTARWSTVSNDPYGRSPGMDCLGDTKQLQMETRRKGEFIEKLVRPPMGADPELKNEPSSILPGHITYTSTVGGKKGFYPLFEVNAAALPPMVEDIKEIQARIERCFFVDTFMAITRMEGVQPRNELELTKRDLERLQVLGPFVHLFETECAEPAIRRALAILQRRGLVKPMPDSMKGIPLKVDFVSMMKVAQSASANTGIASTLAQVAQLEQVAIQSGAAGPLDNFDLDASVLALAENAGFPAKGIRAKADVAKMRQIKQQAAQAQQAAQIAPAAAGAAKDLASAQMGTGSALDAIMGR